MKFVIASISGIFAFSLFAQILTPMVPWLSTGQISFLAGIVGLVAFLVGLMVTDFLAINPSTRQENRPANHLKTSQSTNASISLLWGALRIEFQQMNPVPVPA